MKTFVSDPIELPQVAADRQFSRADLVFYGVDARHGSFSARIFLDPAGAEPDLSPSRAAGYAGFFHVFGHGGCFGDDGHCDVQDKPADPFDNAPTRAPTLQTRIVDITDALNATEGGQILVTGIAVVPGQDAPAATDDLQFSSLRLLVYT
jgi:hypothetical protein